MEVLLGSVQKVLLPLSPLNHENAIGFFCVCLKLVICLTALGEQTNSSPGAVSFSLRALSVQLLDNVSSPFFDNLKSCLKDCNFLLIFFPCEKLDFFSLKHTFLGNVWNRGGKEDAKSVWKIFWI